MTSHYPPANQTGSKMSAKGVELLLSLDDLRVLDLEGVGVTAVVLPDGSLEPVDRLWEKLDQQAIGLAGRGLLHTVVVAEGQWGVPEEYLSDAGATLRIIKSKSVADAVRKLNEQ